MSQEYEGITFGEYEKLFIKDKGIHVEQNTIRSYNNALKWTKKLNDMLLKDITHIHIQDCVNNMIKSSLKRSTIQSYLTKINHLFDMAAESYQIIVKIL